MFQQISDIIWQVCVTAYVTAILYAAEWYMGTVTLS